MARPLPAPAHRIAASIGRFTPLWQVSRRGGRHSSGPARRKRGDTSNPTTGADSLHFGRCARPTDYGGRRAKAIESGSRPATPKIPERLCRQLGAISTSPRTLPPLRLTRFGGRVVVGPAQHDAIVFSTSRGFEWSTQGGSTELGANAQSASAAFRCSRVDRPALVRPPENYYYKWYTTSRPYTQFLCLDHRSSGALCFTN